MPFDLKNTRASYQQSVDHIFKYFLGITIEFYTDDIIVTSKCKEDHLKYLQQVFDRLNHFNMKLNANKCIFGVTSVKFPGYMVTNQGIEAVPAKLRVVANMLPPKSRKQIQNHIGMIVALKIFISKASDRTKLLIHLLKKGSTYKWTEDCQKSFDDLKIYLHTPPMLVIPMSGDILGMYLGVKDFTISGVLFQEIEKPRSQYTTSAEDFCFPKQGIRL